ncbi:MAG: CRISPR-associated endonuclease Cas3'' [Chlorobiales bacterium]|nr:CRISPR-associated endonuclease Cas3'' [Chlorobiales bacterium]
MGNQTINPHKPIAHLRQNDDGSWTEHDLKDHVQGVAQRAAQFAEEFGNGDWAKIAGLLHDLGKYNPEWQAYIRKNSGNYSEEDDGQD